MIMIATRNQPLLARCAFICVSKERNALRVTKHLQNQSEQPMRKRKTTYSSCLAALALLGMGTAVQANIIGQDLGTVSPPSALGGWSLASFPADGSSLESTVSSVTGPGGVSVDFSNPLTHQQVGAGWGTWSHGYNGDVYWTGADQSSVTISLPTSTRAFSFYAEPDQWDTFNITATDSTGKSVSVAVAGNGGANGFGFYTDAADSIVSITVTTTDTDFALGEFGIATASTGVPEGGSTLCYAFLGLLPLCGLALRFGRAA
jgi:hypothetical protein